MPKSTETAAMRKWRKKIAAFALQPEASSFRPQSPQEQRVPEIRSASSDGLFVSLELRLELR